MSDLRIQYTEEMVGAGHPTKDDTLNRLVLADHDNDGSHRYLGLLNGLAYRRTGADQVTFDGFSMELLGKLYKLDAQTPVTFSGLGASELRYLYAQAPASGATLSASEFSSSAAAPARDHAKMGWYDAGGTKRCIGFFRANASSEILAFYKEGAAYHFQDWYEFHNASSGNQTGSWGLLGTGAPALGRLSVVVHGYAFRSGSSAYVAAADGDCSEAYNSDKHRLTTIPPSDGKAYGDAMLLTNASQQIKYLASAADATITMWLKAVLLPSGMI